MCGVVRVVFFTAAVSVISNQVLRHSRYVDCFVGRTAVGRTAAARVTFFQAISTVVRCCCCLSRHPCTGSIARLYKTLTRWRTSPRDEIGKGCPVAHPQTQQGTQYDLEKRAESRHTVLVTRYACYALHARWRSQIQAPFPKFLPFA